MYFRDEDWVLREARDIGNRDRSRIYFFLLFVVVYYVECKMISVFLYKYIVGKNDYGEIKVR